MPSRPCVQRPRLPSRPCVQRPRLPSWPWWPKATLIVAWGRAAAAPGTRSREPPHAESVLYHRSASRQPFRLRDILGGTNLGRRRASRWRVTARLPQATVTMAVGHDIAASVRRSRFPARFLWPKATFAIAALHQRSRFQRGRWPKATFAIATLRPKATFTIVAPVAKGHTHRSLGQTQRRPRNPIARTSARCKRALPPQRVAAALQATGHFGGHQPGATPRVTLARDSALAPGYGNHGRWP